MKLHNPDVVALVVSTNDCWKTVCVTEYTKDGSWYNGLNLITTLEDVMVTAWAHKLNVIPESIMHDKEFFVT